jgi:aspartate carbamoyltransferase catalytic subunit
MERADGAPPFPSLREYARFYGMNSARLAAMKPEAIVMHPGPMNRGVEISADVADGERSLVLTQVESGVAVRMAVMYLLLGGADSGVAA